MLFRQRFYEHVNGYDIFHTMCQVLVLSREQRDAIFIATKLIRW